MTREEFEQLSVEYATGSLRGDELERFEGYLRDATVAERAEVSELISTAALLPLTLESNNPPPRVKEQLMQKIRLSTQAHEAAGRRQAPASHPPMRFGRVAMWTGVAMVALVALLTTGWFVLNLMSAVEHQKQQITALRSELAQKEAMLNILSSRQIAITLMNGQKVNPAGYGKVIWDPERKIALLQVSHLPPVPQGKDYQLWVIQDKTPISAGVFAVTDTAATLFKIEQVSVTNPRAVSAFAVTLEPKGGVTAPTGDMYLAGSPKL